MAGSKIVTVTIDDDGKIELDQVGYQGKACQGDIKDLLNALGEERSTTQKPEFHKENKQQIQQRF